MKYFLLLSLAIISGIGCSKNHSKNSEVGLSDNFQVDTSFSIRVFESAGQTFGYDIYKGEKLLIHQPHIPAVQGENGFKTSDDANKVARFAISKMVKGEMPPTISVEELKDLKILL